jgi:hypothetical protein
MFAGIDFQSKFEKDNFAIRRSRGNWYDPESLITGAEIARGLTYTNSKRYWENQSYYLLAVEGYLTIEEIIRIAPRELVNTSAPFIEEEGAFRGY